MYRRNRRNRLRYRKPKGKDEYKPTGWLAPSIQHKLETHHRLIEKIKSLLPVRSVTIEVANFDIQAIKKPEIKGTEYQQGEQAGFWNLREYILHRDSHQCQNPDCRNRAKEVILEVHHIGYWQQDRTNRVANLITLCTKCHTPENHLKGGLLYGWQPKLRPFRAETFMNTVRRRLIREQGQAEPTFGYKTKTKRIRLGLPKSHHNDAFVIAGGDHQSRCAVTDWEQNQTQ